VDIDPSRWLDIFRHNPVLVVLLFGWLAGSGAAQGFKVVFFAYGDDLHMGPEKIGQARYRANMYVLAIVLTCATTDILWVTLIPGEAHGLRRVCSGVNGLCAPYLYRIGKGVLKWKFPIIAQALSDNGYRWTRP
jgi:hypothetical protein